MTYQSKVVYAFNNFYLNFLTDLKGVNDASKKEVKKNFKVFDKASDEYFKTFKSNMQDAQNDDDVLILPSCSLSKIIELVGSSQADKVKSYLIIFKILLRIYEEDDETLLAKTLEVIKSIQTNVGEETLSSSMKEIMDDDLVSLFKNLADALKPQGNDANDADDVFGMLQNSTIGSLAKEISEEINIDELNISSPEQLLDFSGSNNVLGNIISKVSNKIQNKISTGQLSQTDLVNEAISLVGMINGGKGGKGGANGLGDLTGSLSGLMSNPMFSEILGSMSGMSGMAGKNTKVHVDESKVKNMETRERLRAKLEKKRQMNKKTDKA